METEIVHPHIETALRGVNGKCLCENETFSFLRLNLKCKWHEPNFMLVLCE